MSSRNRFHRLGLNTPPWSTPYIYSKFLPRWSPHFTRDVAFWNIHLIAKRKFPVHPVSINLKRSTDRFIRSNADLKSTKHVYKGRPFALYLPVIPFSINILSVALDLGLNPFWKGSSKERHSFANCSRLFKMPSKSFPIVGVIAIVR